MSVYTHVARHELEMLLANYSVGSLLHYQGINAGVINSNFFVDTSAGQYVLTLFETLDAATAAHYLELMRYYSARGLPVALPINNHFSSALMEVNGKPAALVQRMPGDSVIVPTPQHCRTLGTVLGKLHLQGRAYPQQLPDSHGRQWRRATTARLLSRLSVQEAKLLQREEEFQNLYRLTDMPMGVIHADLFRDNVLFYEDQLTAVLDWYNACNKALLYDVAVAANDWCIDAQGRLQTERTLALLQAYHQQRPLTAIERGAWPVLLRAAALRFWLSRLHAKMFPRRGDMIQCKDPEHFRLILEDRITHHDEFYSLWVS